MAPLQPERAERAAEAYRLRQKGLGYVEIGEAMGCATSTAHELVQVAIKARMPQAAEEERQLEVARYDSWLRRLEDRLEMGAKPEAVVPILLKVSERRAKLCGLDAPKRVRISEDAPPRPEFADTVAFAEREARAEEDRIRGGEEQAG